LWRCGFGFAAQLGILLMGTVTALKNPATTAPLDHYNPGPYYCELLGAPNNRNRTLTALWHRLQQIEVSNLAARAKDSERELFTLGITFTVYSDRNAIDRILPFDVLPRVLTAEDWRGIDAGVKQRVKALNLFLWDIYHDQRIIKDGTLPAELVLNNANFRPEMMGYDPPCGTYIHIAGTDIIRDGAGEFYVLEDNGRTPSGVSYVVENRHLMQRAFPDLMQGFAIESVSEYGSQLAAKLAEVAPAAVLDPQVVLLSPGVFNSAYFEHVFLAREIGIPLVEGRDLVVENDRVFMKTVSGPKPVHVIYRRLNDDFLDPEIFNPESALGVPGLMRAVRKGAVTLANAVGTGVADDKAVYAYVPRIIRYYLGEEPVLPNVKTYICRERQDLTYTLDNLDKLVVKPVGESGGYGICVGPKATKSEIDIIREALKRDPANYISQPMIDLSVCPTLTDDGVEARHVDLRPFAVTGESTWLLPGGLTRVALKKGSIVVNSSQGGGTKDTWVLKDDAGEGGAS
jgi:uncharacterized circularly permuted ATP-grasp superfamily protein